MLESIHNVLNRIYASVSGVLSVNISSITGAIPVTQWTGDNTNGVFTSFTSASVSVTNSSGTLIAENQNANYRSFYNNNASAVLYIDTGTAVTTKGLIILKAGERFEMSAKHGNLYRGALNAIASAATQTCIVVEGS